MASEFQEGAWRRAWEDTGQALHTRLFWGMELTLSPVIALAIALSLPVESEWWEKILVAAAGGFATALALLGAWLIWNLGRAPYRQRDEARSVVRQQSEEKHIPHNRDAVVGAITDFERAAHDLVLEYDIV